MTHRHHTDQPNHQPDQPDHEPDQPVVVGVDTHLDFHVAAVISPLGALLGTETFPATAAGYNALISWTRSHGPAIIAGIEGPSSYGAGLSAALRGTGIEVHEVDRPDRASRRRRGKTDAFDAEAAARRVLSGLTHPAKINDGVIESLRMLKVQHTSATKQRTATINQMHQIRVTCPETLRATLTGLTKKTLPAHCTRFRINTTQLSDPVQAAKRTLRGLARRVMALDAEIADLEADITALVTPLAPRTLAAHGTGPLTVAQLLITVGSNPDRFHSEAGFAALCGTNPIPASSGKTDRHRLNRGGDRHANSALHMICLSRLAHHPPTRAYIAARTTDNKSTPHLRRKLKRYIARELFTLLRQDLTALTNPSHAA